jgi:hypothetical protein
MKVKIKQIDDRNYEVNGKIIQMDMNGNWVAKTELTPMEAKIFHRCINNAKLHKNRLN